MEAVAMNEFDFSSINKILQEDSIDFEQLVSLLINGNYEQCIKLFLEKIRLAFMGVFDKNEMIIKQILVLTLMLAVYMAISKVFSDKILPEMGFYAVYLVLITLFMTSFEIGYQVATNLMEKFFSFLVVVLPVFYLAVAYAGNQAAAAGYYQVSLLIMTGTEWLLLTIVFPFIKIYTILKLLNELGQEKYFDGFLKLGEKAIKNGTKLLLASTVGMQAIQVLILPQADIVKNKAFIKAASVIPTIGGVTQAMSSVLLGSGVLIRNGIGVAAMICLMILCLIPFIQLVVTSMLFHLCSAVIVPIADKRVSNCVSIMADGFALLLKVMTCCLCIFLIIIASVCAMTGNGV